MIAQGLIDFFQTLGIFVFSEYSKIKIIFSKKLKSSKKLSILNLV
jgi:hypothetical protein